VTSTTIRSDPCRNCAPLKPGTLVHVKGWSPYARVVSLLKHRVTVRYETVTAHEIQRLCYQLEAIPVLDQLAELA
jgi:hypothetical protein